MKNLKVIGMKLGLLFSGLLLWASTGLTQDDPLSTRLDVSVIQTSGQPVTISAKLRAKDGRSFIPVKGETIMFTVLSEDDYVEVGQSNTDSKGMAYAKIEGVDSLDQDEDGLFTVMATYEGSERYEEAEEEYYFKPAQIYLETEEDEESRTLSITATTVEEGEEVPLVDYEVKASVPMMFSNLPIGTDYTDDDGMIAFDFPDDLPGDAEGNVKIIAEILETDEYGVLREEVTKQWGIPKQEVVEETRTLWSPNAPLWMVVTFTLLMLVVWGHFIYIIFRLYRLSKFEKLTS